jgi:iron complex outermembrane recepter protein
MTHSQMAREAHQEYIMKLLVIGVLFCCTLLLAQSPHISGTVLDVRSGLPLSGATVLVRDTHLGSITDQEGRFYLDIGRLVEATLEIRLLGYVSQTFILTAETRARELSFRLQPTVVPLQNMLVTASRIREQPFSASYSHLPQRTIQERYTVQDIPVLLSELPSTTYYSEAGNGIGYTYLNIRGFDQRRISVMVNGVPQNDPEDHMVYWLDFPDLAANLENIQVQRGAGNPWGGTPSIGGAINLVSSNFTRQKGITLSTGAGSYNTKKYSLAAASGLIDNHYSIYARLSKMTSDGYRENSWIDFNSYFLGVARFDGDMTTQINLYGGPVADHLAYYGVDKSALTDRSRRRFNPIQRKEEIENFSQPHYELINEWKKGNWTIQNTFFYVLGEGFYDYDGSWAPYSYFRLTRANGFAIEGNPEDLYIPDALIHAVVENKQGGWLPRLVWQNSRHVVTMGGEMRQHRSYHVGSLKWGQALPIGVTPDYSYYEYRGAKSMQSVFINELYHASDRLTLMGDAVLVHHTYRLYDEKYIGTDFKVPYLFFNPKIGASYQVNNGIKAYVTFAATSREPRLKNLYDAAEASTPADWGPVLPQFQTRSDGTFDYSIPLVREETMHNWELGGTYQNPWAQLGANVYLMNFSNEIVKSGRLDRFGQPVTGNAEKTMHQGLELMARWLSAPQWEFAANATFSHNRLVHHKQYTWEGADILDGNPIAGFPDVLANGRIGYHSHELSVSLSLRYVGAFYTTHYKKNDQKVDAHTVANLQSSWQLPAVAGWQGLLLQLQVNNLFNTLYAAHGEGDEYFPGATRNVFLGLNMEL